MLFCPSEHPLAYLAQYAYAWFSAICEKNEDLTVYKELLVLALRLGFRRDDIHADSLIMLYFPRGMQTVDPSQEIS